MLKELGNEIIELFKAGEDTIELTYIGKLGKFELRCE